MEIFTTDIKMEFGLDKSGTLNINTCKSGTRKFSKNKQTWQSEWMKPTPSYILV